MTAPRSFNHFALIVAFAMAGVTAMNAQDKPGGKTTPAPQTPAPTTTTTTTAGAPNTHAPAAIQSMQGLGAFGQLLPMGQRNLDVKIPSFRDGLPSSMVRAGCMTKVDDQTMEIEKMDIRLYGVTKDRDVRVQLMTANYNMPSQVLSSEERSRISRQDFQLEGDEMIFDTNTQQGKLSGRVEMIIFDTAGMMAPEPPKPAETTDPAKKPDSSTVTKPKTAPGTAATPSSSNDKK